MNKSPLVDLFAGSCLFRLMLAPFNVLPVRLKSCFAVAISVAVAALPLFLDEQDHLCLP